MNNIVRNEPPGSYGAATGQSTYKGYAILPVPEHKAFDVRKPSGHILQWTFFKSESDARAAIDQDVATQS